MQSWSISLKCIITTVLTLACWSKIQRLSWLSAFSGFYCKVHYKSLNLLWDTGSRESTLCISDLRFFFLVTSTISSLYHFSAATSFGLVCSNIQIIPNLSTDWVPKKRFLKLNSTCSGAACNSHPVVLFFDLSCKWINCCMHISDADGCSNLVWTCSWQKACDKIPK